MKVRTLLLGAHLIVASLVQADVSLPNLFNNDMVIQRDTQAPIWGWAEPGEQLSIKASWGAQATATAGKDGTWMVKLQTPEAGGPHTLTITGKNSIELNNVLSGDVWLCSGQSNMAWPVNSFKGAREHVISAKYPEIRFYKLRNQQSTLPINENIGRWEVCSPNTVRSFSATGFYFGREIYKSQKIPIGLVSSAWNGTKIEPWIPSTGYRLIPELKQLSQKVDMIDPLTNTGKNAYKEYFSELKKWAVETELNVDQSKPFDPIPQTPNLGASHQSPTYLYNAMIHPIVPAAIKGVIWYQGESNDGEGISYYYKMQALINGWRKAFNQGDFPFYFVQLASFRSSDPNNAEGGEGWASLRQAQLDSLRIKNTGMAVAIDIGDARDIHPWNKQDVGKRLAQWSLAKDYGQKDIVYSGPLYKNIKVEGNKAIISFDHVGFGLMLASKTGTNFPVEEKDGKLSWFSICGKDKKWYKADAVIKGNTVVVSSPNVSEPFIVRYAYTMNPMGCNLYNKAGLPASPFTTEITHK